MRSACPASRAPTWCCSPGSWSCCGRRAPATSRSSVVASFRAKTWSRSRRPASRRSSRPAPTRKQSSTGCSAHSVHRRTRRPEPEGWLDLFEHQGKELFARWGIPVPAGRVVAAPGEARRAAEELGGRVALKAQVAAGGRGKAGGVKVVGTPDEAEAAAGDIFGMVIGAERVERLLVEAASRIEAEYYAAVTLDRRTGSPLFMLSARGGVDVEAAGGEGSMATVHVDPLLGLADFQVRALVLEAGLDARAGADAASILPRLYRLFVEADAQLVEVNPLALTATADGVRLVALDSKVSIDDSALFRHPDFRAFVGTRRPDLQEQMAADAGLNFVKLDGDVGIIG